MTDQKKASSRFSDSTPESTRFGHVKDGKLVFETDAETKRRLAKSAVRTLNLSKPGSDEPEGYDLAKLSTKARKRLPASVFVFPKTRSFPIPDLAHARAALRLAGRVSPAKAARVRAAVYRRYPQLRPKG